MVFSIASYLTMIVISENDSDSNVRLAGFDSE